MKQTLRIVAVIAVLCAVTGIIVVRQKTRAGHGRAAKPPEKTATLNDVLPEFDNDPAATTSTFKDKGVDWVFHVARKEGKYVGAAVVSTSRKGYGGPLQVLVGFQANNSVREIRILSHEETAAFGAMIQDPGFRNQFSGRQVGTTRWKIRNEGGDINAITGATISCRAVTDAVRICAEVYARHAEEISRTGETPATPAGKSGAKRSSEPGNRKETA